MSDDYSPAFPTTPVSYGYEPTSSGYGTGASPGMSLRQYAAIQLRVPDSGVDWLDGMIQQARRDSFASDAMAGMLANDMICGRTDHGGLSADSHVDRLSLTLKAFLIADAMASVPPVR